MCCPLLLDPFNSQSAVITLHVNGGGDVRAVVPPGQEKSLRVTVNSGIAPTVSFVRRKGHSIALPVHDGGSYTFRMVRGEVRLMNR